MALKRRREQQAKGRAAKRTRTASDVPTVVKALTQSEALPEGLRNLLKVALPIVFSANKDDRHPIEVEVVDQAQQGLEAVQAAMEQSHKDALTKQNEVVSAAERARRVQAVKDAETHLSGLKVKVEADKATKKAAEKAVGEAEDVLKGAKAEHKKAAAELSKVNDKKAHVTNVLATEFALLETGTSNSPGGKKAVQTLVGLGKEYGLDGTLIATLPITCKKEAETRTEFETMLFSNLKGLLESTINGLAEKVSAAEPAVSSKDAQMTAAQAALAGAQDALKAASDELAATQSAISAATKDLHKADAHRRQIWADMRHACDSADSLAKQVSQLKEDIFGSFNKLKEKAPAPEPVEAPAPEAEAAPEAVPGQ